MGNLIDQVIAEFDYELDDEVTIPQGGDDRKPLTYFAPWRYICQIEIKSTNSRAVGTGTLIGPSTVLTAAHNVWKTSLGNISVHQGRNGPKSLNSLQPATKDLIPTKVTGVKFPDGLTNPMDSAQLHLDYALVYLNEAIGNKFGYWSFNYRTWPDDPIGTSIWSQASAPATIKVNIAGYPGDIKYASDNECSQCMRGRSKNPHCQMCAINMSRFGDFLYWDFDKVVRNDGKLLKYENDTYPGNSGSPIFQTFRANPKGNGRVLIGIHTGPGDTNAAGTYVSNRAVFINRSVQEFIRRNTR